MATHAAALGTSLPLLDGPYQRAVPITAPSALVPVPPAGLTQAPPSLIQAPASLTQPRQHAAFNARSARCSSLR